MKPADWIRRHRGVCCFLLCAAALLVAAGTGWFRVHAQSQSSMPLPTIDLPRNTKAPAQAPARASTPAQQVEQPAAPAGGDAGKSEAARESADLLKMATDLKIAVDKSTKDELSLAVVRKASEIEQLAHKVRTGTAQAESRPPQVP